MRKLITKEQHDKMLKNGRLAQHEDMSDTMPVIKLFTPDGSATWLLSEIDPDNEDIAFGLCDL